MDEKRLEEIRVRCEAATPGPWMRLPELFAMTIYTQLEDGCRGYKIAHLKTGTEHADADFIAHAREDIPYLLSELSKLRKERDAADDILTLADMIGVVNLTDWDFEKANKIRRKWRGPSDGEVEG